jgi:NTE family protein
LAPRTVAKPKRINLALQGGGAHGAFTWGVLDRLLDEEGLEIAAISGASAGALNGAALKAGMVEGGRAGAKANLDWLWAQIGAQGDLRLTNWMTSFSPAPGLISQTIETSLPFSLMETASRLTSPYALGPFYRNPLEPIAKALDYDRVCAHDAPALFVSATNVRSGKIRVFGSDEISPDVLMATTCLPTLFQAVEFDDPKTGQREAFWDGGYMGNPALFPLFRPEFPDDVVIVNINPLYRDDVPMTPHEILNRINEISFNSSLLRELRAIAFAKRLLSDGTMPTGAMKDVLVHMIADDALMTSLSVATKMVPTPLLMGQLKEAGQAAAEAFIAGDAAALGKSSSVELGEMFD